MKKGLLIIIVLLLIPALTSCKANDLIPDSCSVYTITEEPGILGYINGYAIIRPEFQIRCDMIVWNIIVDGYDFGFFADGCDSNLDWIGYTVEKSGVEYSLQELVDSGKITTAQIYHLYMCDPYHRGNTD